MKIVKPYGRSHVAGADAKRQILIAGAAENIMPLTEFVTKKDELILAQYIALIDKILPKPFKQGQKPSKQQRQMREDLSGALWHLIRGRHRINLNRESELKKIWAWKIHPYDDNRKPNKNDQQNDNPPYKLNSRKYQQFWGKEALPKTGNDFALIAERIDDYLWADDTSATSRPANIPQPKDGLIQHRARAIANSSLQHQSHKQKCLRELDISDDLWDEYRPDTHDLAQKIHQAIQKQQNKKSGHLKIAMGYLHTHYLALFPDGQGGALSHPQAHEKDPDLYGLHQWVKACYVNLLKKHTKSNICQILPKNDNILRGFCRKKQKNQQTSHLIRLGRILHYQALDQRPAGAETDYNLSAADLERSRFWGSDGQAEIKRAEAFIRIWRLALSQAGLNLRNWIAPTYPTEQADILSESEDKIKEHLDWPHYRDKIPVLFGCEQQIFPTTKTDHQKFICQLQKFASNLRNQIFHFKTPDLFIQKLQMADQNDAQLLIHIGSDLYDRDQARLKGQIFDSLQAVESGKYLSPREYHQLLSAVIQPANADLPLPRLATLLTRADNVWDQEKKLSLPKPVNRAKMEANPRLRCQYVCLKQLYQGPFRHWLSQLPGHTLHEYAQNACDRATQAAQKINSQKLATAKAANLLSYFDQNANIHGFLAIISAETAREFRVQKGYHSAPENARDQSLFLENLKLDIIAQAFDAFLKAKNFQFLTCLDRSEQQYTPPIRMAELLASSSPTTAPTTPWQGALYLLCHLIPVTTISQLLHQCRKWEILSPHTTNPTDASLQTALQQMLDPLCQIFQLYLSVHDAKFTEDPNLTTDNLFLSDLKDHLFDSDDSFDRLFQPSGQGTGDALSRLIPRRGLRELYRFGHQKMLIKLCQDQHIRISAEDLDQWQQAQAQIADWQKTREGLHRKWQQSRRRKAEFSDQDAQTYQQVIQQITQHRDRSHHISLTDLTRLSDLMTEILARLVDFSGLWERDLYFVTLALCHQNCQKTENDAIGFEAIFKSVGLRKFHNGQIIHALNNFKAAAPIQNDQIKDIIDFDGLNDIRNNLAHFNMLAKEEIPNLTDLINQTRSLLNHDRKLKNAVGKAIRDLVARHNIDLDFDAANHQLTKATIASQQIRHLGKQYLLPDGTEKQQIVEELVSNRYLTLVAKLFAGRVKTP